MVVFATSMRAVAFGEKLHFRMHRRRLLQRISAHGLLLPCRRYWGFLLFVDCAWWALLAKQTMLKCALRLRRPATVLPRFSARFVFLLFAAYQAYAEKANEMSDSVAVLTALSKESVGLLQKIDAHCT